MRIVVFGAAGRTGQIIVSKALAAGHGVRAFCRRPDAVPTRGQNPEVVLGDVGDLTAVRGAVSGCDAVVSAIGARTLRAATPRADAMVNILSGIRSAAEQPRLIAVSALGAGESRRGLSPGLRVLFATVLRNVMADHTIEEELIRASGIDATIVRPAALIDAAERGAYRVDAGSGIRGGRIPRGDVAAFIVHELSARAHPGATVAIA